jgi:hypothetical protein
VQVHGSPQGGAQGSVRGHGGGQSGHLVVSVFGTMIMWIAPWRPSPGSVRDNVVGGLTTPLPGAHIPWRLWRGFLNAASSRSGSEWLTRQGPTDQHTGACALRGLKRSCVSAVHPAAGVWPVGDRLNPDRPRRRFLLLLLLLDDFFFSPPLNLSLIIPNTVQISQFVLDLVAS